MMIRTYFVYNGQQHFDGTIIKMKLKNNLLHYETIQEMTFTNISNGLYCCRHQDKRYIFAEDEFFNQLVEIVLKCDYECNKTYEFYNNKKSPQKELDVPGMFLAWLWYIFIMIVSIIFKDCIMVWVVASIMFFGYRKNKLREAGYKK